MEGSIKQLTQEVVRFRDQRDWRQFHNSKDLALAISIEASELNELFLWKDAKAARSHRIADELADVLMFSLLLAHENGINIEKAIREKLRKNTKKYPVAKAKGNAKKYTEL